MNLKIVTSIFPRILTTIFLIVIFIPSLRMISGDKTFFSLLEKRALAELPAVPENLSQVQSFFSGMDQYLNDHFGFREWMIYRYQEEVIKRFGEADNVTKVIRGKDNWYFLTEAQMLEDFTGRNLLKDDALERWIVAFKKKRTWLEERGIRYLLVVPPNKINVYSEYVGPPWSDHQGMRRLTQIKNRLSESDRSVLLDLTPVLRKKNTEETLYFKSDTHWTPYGAYLAYQAIAEKIESLFPEVRFRKDFSFTPVLRRRCGETSGNCGDLTNILMAYDSFDESYRDVEEFHRCAERSPVQFQLSNVNNDFKNGYFRTSCRQGKLRAVVFRDSFFGALEPFFSENFKDVIYLWKEYDQKNIEELLLTFKPHIVIEEKLERIL